MLGFSSSIPSQVDDTPVLSPITHWTPCRAAVPQKDALGSTGMAASCPATALPALPWDRSIYLYIFQALLRVKPIQRLVRFDCKAILSTSFHCAMIPRAMGHAGDRQVTGAGRGEPGQGRCLCPGHGLGAERGDLLACDRYLWDVSSQCDADSSLGTWR